MTPLLNDSRKSRRTGHRPCTLPSPNNQMQAFAHLKNITVERCGVLNCGGPQLGATFEVDGDLSPLFPLLNGREAEARYYDSPKRIQFVFDGVLCTLFGHEIVAAAFHNDDEAHVFADKLLAYLNDLHKDRDTIEPDHTVIEFLSPMDIYRLLPKTNCRECGQESCLAFAALLSKGKISSANCPDFAVPVAQKAVYHIPDSCGNLSSTIELPLPQKQRRSSIPEGLLTKREVEVLKTLAHGASNHEIAESLFISPHTVKTHIAHIYDKLGVNDRAQAAVWAARHNIL